MASIAIERRAGDSYLEVASSIPVRPYETIRLIAQGFVAGTPVRIEIPDFGFSQTATANLSGGPNLFGNAYVDTTAPGTEGSYTIQATGRTNRFPIFGAFFEETVQSTLQVSQSAPPPPQAPPNPFAFGHSITDSLKTLAVIGGLALAGYIAIKYLPKPKGQPSAPSLSTVRK